MPTLCDDCALATFKEGYDERDQAVGMAIFRLMKTGEMQTLPSEKLRQWRREGPQGRWVDNPCLRTEDVQSPRHKEPPLLDDAVTWILPVYSEMTQLELGLYARCLSLAWHDQLKGNDRE